MKAATQSYKSLNTIKQYFTLSTTDYWHIQYPLNSDWASYYWDMSEKAFRCELPRDNSGVTLYYGEDGSEYYSSIELIQYAMASFQSYLKTNEEYWLSECFIHVDKYLSLAGPFRKAEYTVLNHYPISLYKIDYPWPSALSLGVACSLLVRLFELFGKKEYLDAALKLSKNFCLDVEDGGVLRFVEYKGKSFRVLEEYPSPVVSGVLNGFITGLWGLYDLGNYCSECKVFFEELSKELSENLRLWDGRWWSNYDIYYLSGNKKNRASIHYHMLQVQQLFILFSMTKDPQFALSAENMVMQKHSGILRAIGFFSKLLFRLS